MKRGENLRPGTLSVEEASILGSKGGKASVKARREKKLLSQIYAEFLAEEFDINIDGDRKRITGQKLVNQVVKKIIIAGGSPAVSMLREIREGTEGNKTAFTGADGAPLFPERVAIEIVRPTDAG